MIKHVGKHNNKKIVLLWRQVPNDAHMALVAYSDTLPRMIHDEVMRCLESAVGQNAKDLSDVLFRTVMGDGRNALEVLHREGFIKKVPTSQILITPTAKSSVRLDELNGILDEMEKGEEAVKRMADLDTNAGLQTKKRRKEGREVGMPPNNSSVSRTNIDVDSTDSAAAYLKGTMSDTDLAEQRISQAEKMKAQAEQLMAEAKRLMNEAEQFTPAKNVNTKTKKTTTAKKQEA
jgi:hypothetical protein